MKASTLSVVRAVLTVAFTLFGVAAELNNGGGFWMLASVDPQRQHNAKLTSSVTAAVELAVAECRHQFRFDAWDCPEVAFGEGGGGDYGTAFEKTQSRRKRREQLEGLSKALLKMPSVVGADYKIRMTLEDDNSADRKDRDSSKRRKAGNGERASPTKKAEERGPRKLDLDDEKLMAGRKEGSRTRGKGRRGRHANSSARQRFPRKMRRGSSTNAIGGRSTVATTEGTTITTTTNTTTTTVPTTTTTKTRPRVSRHMDLDGSNSQQAILWRSSASFVERDDIHQGEGDNGHSLAPPNALKRTWKQMPANRETAFIEAVTSAAITHTLTKNCSSGEFTDCGCDARMTKRQFGWKFGGCSDNFLFGSQVAHQFLDDVVDREGSAGDAARAVRLHNIKAGMVAVKKTMRRICKCHGVSGSCTTQTCWSTLGDFREVGDHLKKMYRRAKKVSKAAGRNLSPTEMASKTASREKSVKLPSKIRVNVPKQGSPARRPRPTPSPAVPAPRTRRVSKRRQRNNIRDENDTYHMPAMKRRYGRTNRMLGTEGRDNRLRRRSVAAASRTSAREKSAAKIRQDRGQKSLKMRDLAFLEDSPDYCRSVADRTCLAEAGDERNASTCAGMCRKCGLVPKRTVVQVETSCHCRFQWCCVVTCQTCTVKKVQISCVKEH